MRFFKSLCAAIVAVCAGEAYAGQIYGSITLSGKGVGAAAIEITCGQAVTKGTTNPDGSYRINVPQEGQCTLTLTGYAGRPSDVIFSKPNQAAYSYALNRRPDGNFELQRR